MYQNRGIEPLFTVSVIFTPDNEIQENLIVREKP